MNDLPLVSPVHAVAAEIPNVLVLEENGYLHIRLSDEEPGA